MTPGEVKDWGCAVVLFSLCLMVAAPMLRSAWDSFRGRDKPWIQIERHEAPKKPDSKDKS